MLTNTKLHLVGPLGFSVAAKDLRRAGLDYWAQLEVAIYKDWQEFWGGHCHRSVWCITTKGKTRHSEVSWPREAMMIFGRETGGLPAAVMALGEQVRLPMAPQQRSLNLSNAVAVCVYEYLRQWDYPGLA